MTRKLLALTLGLLLASPATAALAADKVVKSRKVGPSVVSLLTKSGAIVSGSNGITVSVTDIKGKPKAATVHGLTIYMPPMGSMAAMKSEAKLQPARTPGVYTGSLEVEMKGPWQATVAYKDEKGKHRAVLNIVAK